MENGAHLGILACTERDEATIRWTWMGSVKEISKMLPGAEADCMSLMEIFDL